MRKINLMIYMLYCLFCISCNKQKEHKYYYDTGELKSICYSINGKNDSVYYVKFYYKNGIIKQEGIIKNDSIPDGHHKIYYSDGSLVWEGEIKNSVIQDECKWQWEKCEVERFQGIAFEGSPKQLKIGQPYKFRVVMPKTHPQFYLLTDDGFHNLENHENYDLYPWVYTPTQKGRFILQIIFMNEDGAFIVGNQMISFSPEIEVE